MPAPQAEGNCKKRGEVVAGHVGVAKGGEEINLRKAVPVPQRPLGVRDLLDGADDAEGKAVPYNELKERALAALKHRMFHGDDRDERRHEPQDHVQVLRAVDAEREERNRRAWIGARRYRRIVAHRT